MNRWDGVEDGRYELVELLVLASELTPRFTELPPPKERPLFELEGAAQTLAEAKLAMANRCRRWRACMFSLPTCQVRSRKEMQHSSGLVSQLQVTTHFLDH